MARTFKWLHTLKHNLLALALCLCAGCAVPHENPKPGFALGSSDTRVAELAGASTPFAPGSRAARLRDKVISAQLAQAPGAKDWRYRNTDKGPMIFGAALRFQLDGGGTTLRLGAVKRGNNRTYGPFLTFALE